MPSCIIDSINPITMVVDLGGLCTLAEMVWLDVFFSFVG